MSRDTPGKGRRPDAREIEPAAPEAFGRTQVWWGDGKGKTTAALGMAFRAAGHGYRVHVVQLMKGGTDSVEDVRGEYNAIAAVSGITFENLGHYGWHALEDGTEDRDHEAEAQAGFERTRELVDAAGAADLSTPFALDAPADKGVHLLVVDELLYAAERDLVDQDDVIALVEDKPERLELALTGGHESPDYLREAVDLITNVRKEKHHFDAGQRARKGTEF